MGTFVIEGGVPLSGTVVPAGNKNGALPILAAALLTSEVVVIANVPRISDVDSMLALLAGIGMAVEWSGDNEVTLCAKDVSGEAEIDRPAAGIHCMADAGHDVFGPFETRVVGIEQ